MGSGISCIRTATVGRYPHWAQAVFDNTVEGRFPDTKRRKRNASIEDLSLYIIASNQTAGIIRIASRTSAALDLTAQQRREILGKPLHIGLAPCRFKTISHPLCGTLGAVDHHLPFFVEGEVDRHATLYAHSIANLLGDGDLSFDSERGRPTDSRVLPWLIRQYWI